MVSFQIGMSPKRICRLGWAMHRKALNAPHLEAQRQPVNRGVLLMHTSYYISCESSYWYQSSYSTWCVSMRVSDAAHTRLSQRHV